MMSCEFNSKCTIECPKYPMCTYINLQTQLISIQQQLTQIYKYVKESEVKINKTLSDRKDDIDTLLTLITDSEKNKESNNENVNK